MVDQRLIEYLDNAELYKSNGDFIRAIECYKEFLKLDSSHPAVYSVLADLYKKAYGNKSLNEQINYYLKLLELKPNSRLALHGLAFGYEKLNNNDKARFYYEQLLQNNPTSVDYNNYGMFLIHCGDFEQGHKYFTARFEIDDPNLKYPAPEPRWDFKSDISDKTLLVHYEQGFGDTIMYSRFVHQLKKLAKKIIFVAQPELLNLIKNSKIFDGIEIVSSVESAKFDYTMALLDTPLNTCAKASNLPFAEGYLDVQYDRKKSDKFKIGISYKGDKNANYQERDLTIENFEFLTHIEGAEIYSLQKDEEKHLGGIIPLGESFNNFTDTAKTIKEMDLIISTDNVILNLSGALGVKTLGLFSEETNFRWFKTNGKNVGWYNSVKPLKIKDNWQNEILKYIID